ncbi:MAG: corrinoid protein [Phycisphaerae bacterium]|nr:corrinoid protein [Phycisphaerae bacterium]
MADLNALKEAVIEGQLDMAVKITQEAIDDGTHPSNILQEGLVAGMAVVGKFFKANEMFVPEVLIAARAMKGAMEILEPCLAESGVEPLATICVGTVQGDIHDIGKNLVIMMLKGAGFNVIDLGVDVPPEKFIEAAKENNASVVGLSALLTTTMPMLAKTVEAFKTAGASAKVMIGGAPVTQEYADQIGADGYSADAASCVDLAKTLLV